jgi:hypothetical protein
VEGRHDPEGKADRGPESGNRFGNVNAESISPTAHGSLARPTGRTVLLWLVPLAAAALYLFVGYRILATGHPHEDAYILFIFAENLVDTGRISFYAGGPPAEGATDFLWMLAVAALYATGITSALATQLLNAAGVWVISFLLMRACIDRGAVIAGTIFALGVPLTGFVQAGYVGFSAPLYCALVLVTFVLVAEGASARLHWVPVLGLILGLFRPDGVLMAVGFWLVALTLCPATLRRRYLTYSAAVFALGLSYFMWRWSYFGEFLPLPLYVKSAVDGDMIGLSDTLIWLIGQSGYGLMAIGFLALVSQTPRRFAAAVLPVALLIAALAFAHTSQNISLRFQAPGGVVVYYLAALFFYSWKANGSPLRQVILIAAAVIVLFQSALSDIRNWTRLATGDQVGSYIDVFPVLLADAWDDDQVIALTEAGRLAYWMPGRKVDLVGLNTAYPARFGADAAYIERLSPDLIFFHTAHTTSFPCADPSFCVIDSPRFNSLVAGVDLPTASDVTLRTLRAPLAIYEFLNGHGDDYRIYAVSYFGKFNHVYARSKRAGITPEVFQSRLREALDDPGRWSYFQATAAREKQGER